jgi:hypothetical protein
MLCHLPLHSCEPQETVKWFAPIFSGGGYSSEALALAASIGTVSNMSFIFNVEHHGDTYSRSYVEGMLADIFSATACKFPNHSVL